MFVAFTRLSKSTIISSLLQQMFERSGKRQIVTINQIPTWRIAARKLTHIVGNDDLIKPNCELNDKVSIFIGDIVTLQIDAIVNAANRSLQGGGGVDGAIHAAAGRDLKEESRQLAPCNTGEAKITLGYRLPAKHVIHTVGPQIYSRNGVTDRDHENLINCYTNSLILAQEHNLRSIAFPCISTGIYGYPNEIAANDALYAVRCWLETGNNAKSMDRIIFCLYQNEDIRLYQQLMFDYFPIKPLTHYTVQ